MTATQERLEEILDFFDNEARSDPWGWDWPTMRVLFPDLCAEARQLIRELKETAREDG